METLFCTDCSEQLPADVDSMIDHRGHSVVANSDRQNAVLHNCTACGLPMGVTQPHDIDCQHCGARHNGVGQRLRENSVRL